MDKALLQCMPEYITLYYVDRNDNLNQNHDVLQQCVEENSWAPLDDAVWDWSGSSEEYYLDLIAKKMWEVGLTKNMLEDNREEILEYLQEHDESGDPVIDLLDNTAPVTACYSFNQWIAEDCDIEDTKERLCQLFGVDEMSDDAGWLRDMIDNANYGGDLRVYFNTDVRNLVHGLAGEDFKTVALDGEVTVGIINSLNGSGDFQVIRVNNKSFPFRRDRLFISDTEQWGLEEIFGAHIYTSSVSLQ